MISVKKLLVLTALFLSLVFVSCQKKEEAQAGGGAAQAPAAGDAAATGVLPRNETLYFSGIQWGAGVTSNPYANGKNYDWAGGMRQPIFETLFVWNLLDGKLYPQIADSYEWNGQTMTIQLNQNVKFSDGTALTSADVVNTYNLGKQYTFFPATGYWTYIDSVTAQGDYTVVINAKSPFNPKYVEQSISELSITSKAYWDKQNLSSDPGAIAQHMGWDCPGTGPYLPYINDDTKVVLIRNDSYWGQHSSRYGKLPAPKYIAHSIFKDNASGDEAFRRGEVDVSQQFTAQIWRLWEGGAPVETYIPQAPYFFPATIPMIIFNVNKPGLDDAAVRKAIAMAIDYDLIGTNAMSGYTPKVVPSIMLPTPAEQALIDPEALKPYQWTGIDVAGANKLLDDAGWVAGADGIRAKGGVRLSFKAECPTGWSDWQASLEVVAQAGKSIGIDITTYFPEAPVWTTDRENASFDIIMDGPGGANVASPWSRAYMVMGSQSLPPEGAPNQIQNWGRWINPRANEIINALAAESDPARMKTLWTELNVIYLQEMPSVPLMYRPWLFHAVNTSVWTGFPKMGDGTNIPPAICLDGYGIKALYNLKLK